MRQCQNLFHNDQNSKEKTAVFLRQRLFYELVVEEFSKTGFGCAKKVMGSQIVAKGVRGRRLIACAGKLCYRYYIISS